MNKLALGIVGLTALVAAPAMAADMPLKAPTPVPIFSWTGCYLGVHGGAGWESSSWTSETAASGVGVLGGTQAGCNMQWRQFVIGVEGEFWGSTLDDRRFFGEDLGSNEARARNRWDGAISVRSGVAFERAFVYGKLGVVWGKFDYTFDGAGGGNSDTERGNAVFTGVLIGVGFEYALTDNWTTKFEYNYIDYGNKVVNFTDTECDVTCVTGTFSRTIKEIKQIAKVGVNYKFNYNDAIRARY